GRFTLTGFGRERIVMLRLDGPSIETRVVNVITRPGPTIPNRQKHPGEPPVQTQDESYHGATFTCIGGPGTVVEGVVRDRDTGRPLAGVTVRTSITYDWLSTEELATTTDTQGRYRLSGLPRI